MDFFYSDWLEVLDQHGDTLVSRVSTIIAHLQTF